MALLWIINENVEHRQRQYFADYFPEKTGYFCSLILTHHYLFIVIYTSATQHVYRNADASWNIGVEFVHTQAVRHCT